MGKKVLPASSYQLLEHQGQVYFKGGGLRSGNSTYFSLHEGEDFHKTAPYENSILIPLTAPNWINGAER